MSLGIALQNALSGLKVAQQSFGVLSQNIANANNEDYTRQKVSLASQNIGTEYGSGVLIKEVTRVADDFVTGAVITRNADVARASTVKEFYEQAQLYLGQPGNSNSIDSYVNNFFSAITQLSATPERTSIKLNAVNAGQILAQEMSSLAGNLENLRFEADQQIKGSVDIVNTELKKIKDLNSAMVSARANDGNVNAIADQMSVSLKKLSGEIDIKYRTTDDGRLFISTKSGVALLEDNLFQLDYKPSGGVESMINDSDMNAIKVYSLNADGDRIGNPITLVSSGSKDEVIDSVSGGKMKGLLEIRDKLIPDVLDQIDNMAAAIRDQINAIHNNGSGYPPASSLTGTKLVDPSQAQNWKGSVMIAAISPEGIPISSPYASDRQDSIGMAPLTLDLENLSDGNGTGKPTFQTIIDEINRYYGTPKDRTTLQDSTGKTLLSDMKLGMMSDSLTGGAGTLAFDFDLSNLTANGATVTINSASIGSANATVTSPASFPQSVAINAGSQKRTGSDLNFNLNITGAGTVSVTFNVTVTDANGLTSNSTVTYDIPQKTDDYMNDRITASSVTGEATIESPTLNTRIMTAKLVDENGNEVAKDFATGDYTAPGYIMIEGNGQSYRLAINELDSSQKGDSDNNVAATGFGFSHYLGLNDFFKSNDGQKADAAYNLAIRDQILQSPQRISTGQLSASSAQTVAGALPRYTYQLANGSNQAAIAMSQLGLNNIKFAAAGSLPQISMTLSNYAAEILGYISSVTADAQQTYQKEDLIYQGFVDKDRNIRGVNIDEEMANTITFQNAYSANARVISTTKEMFQTLMDAF